ncbi:hypothetical protein [Streptomyces sp. RP5T]|nr:hypothetical protein [Streptomyces sp. RP5T]
MPPQAASAVAEVCDIVLLTVVNANQAHYVLAGEGGFSIGGATA